MNNGASNIVSEVDSHYELDLPSYILASRENPLAKYFVIKGINNLNSISLIHLFIEANVPNKVFSYWVLILFE